MMRQSSAFGVFAILATITSTHGARERMTSTEGGIKFKVDNFDDGRNQPFQVKFTTNDVFSRYKFEPDGLIRHIKAGSEKYKVIYRSDGSLRRVKRTDSGARMLARYGEEADLEDFTEEETEFAHRRLYACDDCEEAWNAVCGVGVTSLCALTGNDVFDTLATTSIDIMCSDFSQACSGNTAEVACDGQCIHGSEGSTCSNGLPGVEKGDICCSEECGNCGGSGCGNRPGGSSNCCVGTITLGGIMCSDSRSAPCIMSDESGDTCDPNPCLNGGSCSSDGNGYVCSCELGYGGTSCETDTFTSFVGKQLEVLADVLDEEGIFTDYTDTDGVWRTVKDNGKTIGKTVWTSGMVAGLYWFQYELTGDAIWETKAKFFCEGLEGVEELDDNDLGFQGLNSFGLGYGLASSESVRESYKARVLTGADSLYDLRWDANIPAFWSWKNPTSRPEWERAVNVDMIMNMEIMLWASVNGGDPTYAEAVAEHADTTWRDIVREPDSSTFHVADYDPDTGALVDQAKIPGTYQGYTDSSTWSRGQAWAVYGYVMIYRYLKEPRFLERSLACLKYFEDNLPSDLVPPADFDAPVSASDNGKDSSSTAIVASALLEISAETGDSTYRTQAEMYLSALLSPDYYLPDAGDDYQSILRRSTAKWGESERGAIFGDYFLLEAMVRYRQLAR